MIPRRLALVLGLFAVVLTGCGGSTGSGTNDDDSAAQVIIETDPSPATSEFRGGSVDPRVEAPAFDLKSQDGRMVRVEDFRGKVVMVSFLFTRCPDICPVIMQKLRHTQGKLGPKAKDTAIVVISVDPKGDTPETVRTFLERRGLTGHVDWLVGTAPELSAAWQRWGILAAESPQNPSLIEHSGVVWILDTEGRRAVYYPLSTIDPDDIAHDVTRLLETRPAG